MSYAFSRRRFLHATAVAAGAAIVPRSLAWAADAKAAQSRFLIGIQSYTFRTFPVDKVLDTAQSLGLGSIEFFNAHFKFDSSADEIAAMKKKAAEHNVEILGHGVNPFTKDHDANR